MSNNRKPRGASKNEETVLVLQGGGALGAYQAGVYEELMRTGHAPDWIAGISIGAINAAIIAGNPPERRVERLRAFWDLVSSQLLLGPIGPGEQARSFFNDASASFAVLFGLPGFFEPRMPPAWAYPLGAAQSLSFYDTAPLRRTLTELVDFDLINAKRLRLSVGAVNIRNGNFIYFDNEEQDIRPEHIMASSALPPGFPPVEVDGEFYWDGGLVSNTPLQFVLDEVPRPDMLVFQVDLFSARGLMPRSLFDVSEREKDIRYSSRTRLNTDFARHNQNLRRATHRLLAKLPASLREDADVKLLRSANCDAAVTIVHLIHRRKDYFTQSKDFEFSRYSIDEHWKAGGDDVRRTFRHKAWQNRSKPTDDVTVFDLTRDARD
ncbi:MAG: patatin-like phospholipase family protein [Alphaproteobacteria bacterium]|nr:patatin-like phospholipase family protein [Alphaproteobacteria bacterium]